jgi:electron transport complex protein RnfB
MPPEPTSSRRIPLVDLIEACLPQTQCGKCKTPGCRPYAEAIAAGEAINHCVPGGDETIAELAALLKVPALPLNPEYGVTPPTRMVAFIREDECIGCTKCIQACPVDAIVGAAKLMHTVIMEDCTGCELCLPPCPVDCIDMVALAPVKDQAERKARAAQAKARFEARNARLEREKSVTTAQPTLAPTLAPAQSGPTTTSGDKSLVIAAALARTNLKKAEKKLAAAQAAGEPTDAIEAEIIALRQQLHDIDMRQQQEKPA